MIDLNPSPDLRPGLRRAAVLVKALQRQRIAGPTMQKSTWRDGWREALDHMLYQLEQEVGQLELEEACREAMEQDEAIEAEQRNQTRK